MSQIHFSKEKAEDSLGFLFWQVNNLWQRKINSELKKLDLTHVQFVLLASIAWLEKSEMPITQTFLADHAKTDIMMTSKVLRTLIKKKLINRESHKTDTRAKVVKLTKEGVEKIIKALPIVEKIDDEFFSSKNNYQLGKTLKKIIDQHKD